MSKEDLVPDIRFEGYNDSWNMQVLSNVTERVIRKNNEFISKNPLTISAQEGLISQLDYYNFQVASKNLSNYYLLEKGDFAYNKSYSKGYPVGAIKRLDYYGSGLLSTLYIVFRPTNIDSNFLKHYYESNYWHKAIYDIAEEGARNHGLLNVAPVQFFETYLNVPDSNSEQRIVGNYFEKIERNIKLKTIELGKFKSYKQAMLQKMFPKEGETLPEVRFQGFEHEWKETSLKDVAKVTMGQSPHGKNYTLNPHDYILVQGNADMKNGQVVPRVWTTQVTKTAVPNDIIMSVRAPVGDVGRTKYNVVLGRGVAGIRANNFIYFYLTHLKYSRYWDKLSTGSTFQSINSNHLNELMLMIPSEEEQNFIGEYFYKLDQNIQSEQAELDKLKQFKQAMLDKMFV